MGFARRLVLSSSLIVVVHWIVPAQADTPIRIKIQGCATDFAGNPIPGTSAEMRFALFDGTGNLLASDPPTGGARTFPVENCLFEADVAFTAQHFIRNPARELIHPQRFVEVTVNGVTIAPRYQVQSVPYAYVAETVGGVPRSGLVLTGTFNQHVQNPDAHREHASLEESTEITASIDSHAAAADPHTAYVRKSGDTMTGNLVVTGGYVLAEGGGDISVENPRNPLAAVTLDWFNDGLKDFPRLRYGGDGSGAGNGFLIQGPGNTTNLMVSNSFVGIGTTSPTERLEVVGNVKVTGALTSSNLRINSGAGNAVSIAVNGECIDDPIFGPIGCSPAFTLNDTRSVGGLNRAIKISPTLSIASTGTALAVNVSGDGAEALRLGIERPWSFRQHTTGEFATLMLRPDQDSLFRIASPNGAPVAIFGASDDPTRNGVSVSVLTILGGADLAEPFKVSGQEAVEPGMLVVIDPDSLGELQIAREPYDRMVAGVVSGANGMNPGLVMKQEGTTADGALPVALTGRVYCYADASYGSIKPGDLLTSSATPGHAMKVTDYDRAQGAIIGKALAALPEGQGLVLVLVSLQ